MTVIINGVCVTMTVDEFIEYQRKVNVGVPVKPYKPFDTGTAPIKWNEITCGDPYVCESGGITVRYPQ